MAVKTRFDKFHGLGPFLAFATSALFALGLIVLICATVVATEIAQANNEELNLLSMPVVWPPWYAPVVDVGGVHALRPLGHEDLTFLRSDRSVQPEQRRQTRVAEPGSENHFGRADFTVSDPDSEVAGCRLGIADGVGSLQRRADQRAARMETGQVEVTRRRPAT